MFIPWSSPLMSIWSSLASNMRIQSTGMRSWKPLRNAFAWPAISRFSLKSATRYKYDKKLLFVTATWLPPANNSCSRGRPVESSTPTVKVRERSSRSVFAEEEAARGVLGDGDGKGLAWSSLLTKLLSPIRCRYSSGSRVYRSSITVVLSRSLFKKVSANCGFTRMFEYTAFPSTRPRNSKSATERLEGEGYSSRSEVVLKNPFSGANAVVVRWSMKSRNRPPPSMPASVYPRSLA
mmetsp:Transcript_61192/g.120042  ORF Transcript_61192/g.120042 Transcript_61192/m.120042 type:complete len:236 (+) Transcript_61192:707-1414(+)